MLLKKFKYQYVCIVDTVYALTLYLLTCDKSKIDRTFFFVGGAISTDIQRKLPHVESISKDLTPSGFSTIVKSFFKRYIKWPFLLYAKIYAQDHILNASLIIGFRNYTLLEDAPRIYTRYKLENWMNTTYDIKGMKNRIISFFKRGSTWGGTFGRNSQCKEVWITDKKDLESDLLSGKKTILLTPLELWQLLDNSIQKFILDLFGLDYEILQSLKEYDTIVFSQPLLTDIDDLTKEEFVNIYMPFLEKYKNTKILVKVHPRDTFNWNEYFPYVHVFQNPIPMQILSYMGVNFKNAITVSSTSVSALPQTTNIIWIGTEINSKVYNHLGNQKLSYYQL